jgi:hypothetical protein
MQRIYVSFRQWIAARGKESQFVIALLIIAWLNSLLVFALTLPGLIEQVAHTRLDITVERAFMFFEWTLFLLVIVAWLLGLKRVTRAATFIYLSYVTIGLASSVLALIATLPVRKSETGGGLFLLWDAFVIWIVNVLIFTVWYWLLDGGGSEKRIKGESRRADFFFPQQANKIPGWADWKPGFVDYLFLAFNTSSAFSPTDTLVLSPRAKMLSLTQAALSLVTLAMAAARAINILT